VRILDERTLTVVWNWGADEERNLRTSYEANLRRLLAMVDERRNEGKPVPVEDLKVLTKEVQQAAETLNECALNCFVLAQLVYAQCADTAEKRQEREEWLQQLDSYIGRPVILTQTSIDELQGKQVTLEAVLGTKAVVRYGEERWETPIDRVAVVLEDAAPDTSAAPAAPPPPAAPDARVKVTPAPPPVTEGIGTGALPPPPPGVQRPAAKRPPVLKIKSRPAKLKPKSRPGS